MLERHSFERELRELGVRDYRLTSERQAAIPVSHVEPRAAEPIFAASVRRTIDGSLSARDRSEATTFNRKHHPATSGIAAGDLIARLEQYIDPSALAAKVSAAGDDERLAELAFQFQKKVFAEAPFHSGKLDESTLDALGFVRHRGRPLNAVDAANRTALRVWSKAWRPGIADHLGDDVTAANWFDFMVDAPFLGFTAVRGRGVHLELMYRLRRAQAHLMTLPAYAALTPVQLGDVLLWDRRDDAAPHPPDWSNPAKPLAALGNRHRGARPTKAKGGMHEAGLAIDLSYRGSPWIGDKDGGREPIREVTSRAVLLVAQRINTGLGRAELTRLGETGLSTAEIYDVLGSWNESLRAYFALRGDDRAIRRCVDRLVMEGTAGGLRGKRTPEDAAKDWKKVIEEDWKWLRKNDFMTNDGVARDPAKGFLALQKDLVVALRDHACLAWGALDLGNGRSGNGDMMHFDCRAEGIGRTYASTVASVLGRGPFVPTTHPCAPPPAARPARPEGEIERELEGAGRYFELPIAEGALLRVGAYVPKGFRIGKGVNAVVFFHGLLPICELEGSKPADHASASTEALTRGSDFALATSIDANAPANTVLLVAHVDWPAFRATRKAKGEVPAFADPSRFGSFLKQALAAVCSALGTPGTPPVRSVVLVGHSAGYEALYPLCNAFKSAKTPQDLPPMLARLRGVLALDATYGSWKSLALKEPTARSKAWAGTAGAPDVSVWVYFNDEAAEDNAKQTTSGGRKLAGYADARLKVIPRTSPGHCAYPRTFLPKFLKSLALSGL